LRLANISGADLTMPAFTGAMAAAASDTSDGEAASSAAWAPGSRKKVNRHNRRKNADMAAIKGTESSHHAM
jgi:hypothetical protein